MWYLFYSGTVKKITCYTLVDLWCTCDLYIVYHGSSKKVLTALLTLADCVGSLNRLSAVSRFPRVSQMATSVVPSDPPYEAMATATEVTDGELSEIPSTVHYPHSERSRSEYGRSQPIVPADNHVRRPPVPMCLTPPR